MKSLDINFKIGDKVSKLFNELYDLLENIPRRDYFLKDKINNLSFDLVKIIYVANFAEDNFKKLYEEILGYLALLNILLEKLYRKKYIPLKQLEKHIYLIREIRMMSETWRRNVNNTNANNGLAVLAAS